MTGAGQPTGGMPASVQEMRTFDGRHRGDGRPVIRAQDTRRAMRGVLLTVLVASVALAGCIEMPFGGESTEALRAPYVSDVEVAVTSLTLVFAQADESVRAFQNGWLAAEGAAHQFGFLRDRVRDIRADVSEAKPPGDMHQFHKQLGRSVTLTQQAMDAMQVGFESGDNTYFELAGEKLQEARKVLDRAVNEL